MKYFFEVFERISRQGPGANRYTKKAYDMIKGYLPEHPKILDVGCGKAVQGFKLGEISNGHVTCVDNHQPFVDFVNKKAEEEYLDDILVAENRDMNALDLPKGRFDVLWAEGSIYNLGFEKGLNELKQFVKTMGFLVVSEAVWLKDNQPEELLSFWNEEYPEITTIEKNLEIVEKCGLKNIAHFTLPEDGWSESFYVPMQNVVNKLREKNKEIPEAMETYDELLKEIEIFNKYKDYFSYEFFIVKKV